MAAPMKQNDSSSEEDENEEKFREAAIDIKNIVHNNVSDGKQQKKRSLRPQCVDEDDNDDYIAETTPGFRKHVCKKLCELIDSQIDEVTSNVNCSCPATESDGIKLFSGSTKLLGIAEDTLSSKGPEKKRKKKYSSSNNSDSSEGDKFAEAAVSHDFIVKESRLLNETPADITGILNAENKKKKKKKKKKAEKEDNT